MNKYVVTEQYVIQNGYHVLNHISEEDIMWAELNMCSVLCKYCKSCDLHMCT